VPVKERSSRVLGLDGLRAIAVIGVLIYHMEPHILPGGFLGVNLFFVLSGYLIALKSHLYEPYRLRDAGIFYVKRIKRIYPALVLRLSGQKVLVKTAVTIEISMATAVISFLR
jgi:peptidoglycan/LPS O-acetylase OafA/YrhL